MRGDIIEYSTKYFCSRPNFGYIKGQKSGILGNFGPFFGHFGQFFGVEGPNSGGQLGNMGMGGGKVQKKCKKVVFWAIFGNF